MKWFDATRGFGFLVSDEAEGDILVHFSVLKEHDRRSLPEGAIVECLVAEQERGPAGAQGLSIDLSQAVVPEPARASAGSGERVDPAALIERCRRVRAGAGQMVQSPQGLWLPGPRRRRQRGYLRPYGDGAPRRPRRLEPDQPLRARIAIGRKGPLAVEVEPL